MALFCASVAEAKNLALDNNEIAAPGGLVGYWRMDASDIAGSTLMDRSGKGNNGVLVNLSAANIVPGQINQAITLNSSSAGINAPSIMLSAMTITAWIKPSSFSAGRFVAGRLGTASPYAHNYYLDIASGGELFFGFWNGSAYVSCQQSSTTMTAGRWYFVAATTSVGVIDCYINAILVAQTSGAGTPSPSGTQQFAIGLAPDGSGRIVRSGGRRAHLRSRPLRR